MHFIGTESYGNVMAFRKLTSVASDLITPDYQRAPAKLNKRDNFSSHRFCL